MGKKRKKEKLPGRSPMPPPGFTMRDRRRKKTDREEIEESLEDGDEDLTEVFNVLGDDDLDINFNERYE